MKEQELKRYLDEIVQETFPDTMDPWFSFQARLQSRSTNQLQEDFSIKKQMIFPKKFLSAVCVVAIAFLALLFAGAFILVTPQGRAWAETLLSFFTHSGSNTILAPTEPPLVWSGQTPGIPSATLTPLPTAPVLAFMVECGDFDSPRCTIEEIRERVKFPVYQLAYIPDGLYWVGATGGPDRVFFLYNTKNRDGVLIISEEPWTGNLDQKVWDVGAGAEIQKVRIGETIGEYVKGAYTSDGSRNTPAKWNSDADVQSLRWVDHEVFFSVQKLGSEPQMDEDALVALVGTMTTGTAVATTPVPTSEPTEDPVDYLKQRFSLSVEQAGQEAGLKLHQPARLPEALSLLGAMYEPDQKVVTIFYLYDQTRWGPNTDGLSLVQQTAPEPSGCGLCGFISGDGSALDTTFPGKLVGKDAKIETVRGSKVTGQYVEGVWSLTDHGPVWDPTSYVKKLRWWANGVAYELEYMGMHIAKEDMIAIAESIK